MPSLPNIVNDTLRCPSCDDDYVNITSVVANVRKREDSPARLVTLTGQGDLRDEERDPMEGHDLRDNDRRQSFTLVGTCEHCGADFAICFKQHKGQTHVGVSTRTWRPVR